jgi:hypothetical protein
MIVYNKINYFQIYNEIAKAAEKTFKAETSAMDMDQKITEAEKKAAEVSMWQLIKM